MMAAAYLPYIMRDPSTQTYRRGVAQPGSAPPWGGGGRRFKSSRPDQHFVPLLVITSSLRSHATSAEDVAFIPVWRARASQALPASPKGRGREARASRTAQGRAVARPVWQRREAQEKRAIRGVFVGRHMNWHVGDLTSENLRFRETPNVSISYRRNAAEDEGHNWTDEFNKNTTWL